MNSFSHRRRHRRLSRRQRFLSSPERLEDRRLLATFNVGLTVDENDGNVSPSDLSLREAVISANGTGAHDTINLGAGTYNLTITGTGEASAQTGDLDITSDVTINGAGAGSTIIDANGIDRIFEVLGGATVNISGVTIRDGSTSGQGAGIFNNGTLTLDGVTFINNHASDHGGALSNHGGTILTVRNSSFDGNSSQSQGGAIVNVFGQLNVDNTSFSNNQAPRGGAIWQNENASNAAEISNSSFTGNSGQDGGAIYVTQSGFVDIADTTFTNNDVTGVGGAVENSGTLSVITSTFTQNDANQDGGGIRNANGGTLNLADSTIENNSAGNSGGGVWNQGTSNIRGTTFVDNMANVSGGGLASIGGTMSIVNSTVSSNDANNGGGLFNGTSSTLNLFHSTVYQNNADPLGNGGGLDTSGTVNVGHTIFSENSGATPEVFGTVNSLGYNLFNSTGGLSGFVGTDILHTNPLLMPLQNNGGPTETHAPNAGSVIIDAGDPGFNPNTFSPPLAADQRSFQRVVDGNGDSTARIDIGAYEDLANPANPNNTAPTLSAIGNQVMAANTTTFMLTLGATDPENDPLTFGVEVQGGVDPLEQLAYSTDENLGLGPEDLGFAGWGQANEKWSQAANGEWYFITPDGNFYRWTGASPGGGFVSGSEFTEAFSSDYHANPSLLFDAFDGTPPAGSANATAQVVGNELHVTPNAGFVGDIGLTVTVSDTGGLSDSETFNLEVPSNGGGGGSTNTAPTLSAIGDQVMAANTTTFMLTLGATDPENDPLTFGVEVQGGVDPLAAKAYSLDQQYGLGPENTSYRGWGGSDEKWMLGSDGDWYFITPNGDFYRWTGASPGGGFVSGSTSIDTLSPAYHADVALLHNATQPTGSTNATAHVNGNELHVTPNAGFAGDIGLTVTVTDTGGLSDSETFNLEVPSNGGGGGGPDPDGDPPILDPIGNRSISHSVASLAIDLSATDPDGDDQQLQYSVSFGPSVDPLEAKAYALDQQHQLSTEDVSYRGWGGSDEKWMPGTNNQWYFITPNGDFYRWTGASPGGGFLSGSELLDTLSPDFYNDLAKLHNAPDPNVGGGSNSLPGGSTAVINNGQLVVDPGNGFVGDLSMTVTVTDVQNLSDSEDITVSVTNTVPSLSLADLTVPFTQDTVTIDLPATDADGDVLQYEVEVTTSASSADLGALAYELDQQLQLGPEDLGFRGWGGSDERWMQAADGEWYFITPDGKFYRWTGAASGSGFVSGSTLVETLAPSFHQDPATLYDAQPAPPSTDLAGVTATIQGNQLEVDLGDRFFVDISVQVTASDGIASASEGFTIHVNALGDVGISDATGAVTLSVDGKSFPFELIDTETQTPLSGMVVSLVLDPETKAFGVASIVDPTQDYGTTVLVVRGPDAVVGEGEGDENVFRQFLNKYHTKGVKKIITSTLPVLGPVTDAVFQVNDFLGASLQLNASFTGDLPPGESVFSVRQGTLDVGTGEALLSIGEEFATDTAADFVVFVAGNVLAPLTGGTSAAVGTFAGSAGFAINVAKYGAAAWTSLACDAQGGQLQRTKYTNVLGKQVVYSCNGVVSAAEQLEELAAQVYDIAGVPFSTGVGVVSAFSKDAFGVGYLGELLNGGVSGDVPSGSYDLVLHEPGYQTYERPVGVPAAPYSLLALPLGVDFEPQISATTNTLSFSAFQGFDPADQTFSITNTGPFGTFLNYGVTDNASWLSVNPISGSSLNQGESQAHTVSINVSGLSIGNHTAEITITDVEDANRTETISVTLTVQELPPQEDPEGIWFGPAVHDQHNGNVYTGDMTLILDPLVGLPGNFTGQIILDMTAQSCGFGSCPPLFGATDVTATLQPDGQTLGFNLVGLLGSGEGVITGNNYRGSFFQISGGARFDTSFDDPGLTKISGLRAEGWAPSPTQANASVITTGDLTEIQQAAVSLWRDTDSAVEQLSGVSIEVVDLPGSLLGAAGGDMILIDQNAAGYGWFVDATPDRNEEFSHDQSGLLRGSGDADGRMDLLTVLSHEMGHLLGLDDLDSHDHASDIMADTLEPGIRRLPWADAVDHAFADDE